MLWCSCLTGTTVNGGGSNARSGAQALRLLAGPLNATVLRQLGEGPRQQVDLRRQTGFPAQSTLRAQLKRLIEVGALEKRQRNRFPGVLEYDLTPAGRHLLAVAGTLEGWLAEAPEGPLSLDGSGARAAIKALAEAWSTTMLRALAAKPLSLTDLDRVIASQSYPSLERRLGAMRLAGQIEAQPGTGRGVPYMATRWLRHAVIPLAAAARWERRHLPEATPPLNRIDIETILLLSVPLLRNRLDSSGSCTLAAELKINGHRRAVGVTVELDRGEIASCATQLRRRSDAWAIGSPGAWLNAIVDGDDSGLELGGNGSLGRAVVGGLHGVLPALPTPGKA